ncbi:MAG TPA: hypothetical protein VFC44_05895, partial [Candidatus Saccharimonadales bacterium]|nr:hypothetical protein [Candidatus Saccharimonadales bacterium]
MMNNGTASVQRYVPLLCWMMVVLTALGICLKILGDYGFVPAGDARRHVARPFANKPYTEIVVLRPEYKVDHSPGWEWMLGVVHRATGWDEDALISFSVASMLLWFFCLPLAWVRRPEAWLAAVLAQMIAIPELMTRLTQGRPFLLTEGILVAFLFSWSREERKNPPWWKIVLTVAGFTLSVWMHGAWYLWAMLPIAFLLAQRWRAACWLAGCWLAGVALGALLTGQPFAFLYGSVFMAASVFREHAPKWLLVGEFQPGMGEFSTLALLALVYLWLKQQNKTMRPLLLQPVVWMIVLNWIGGFMADRFWADWGMPAVVVWLATQFDEGLPEFCSGESLRRVLLCGLIAVPFFMDATNDLNRRYSFSLDKAFVNGSDPKLEGWMPG